jgi:AcrR family transcriptional regulator
MTKPTKKAKLPKKPLSAERALEVALRLVDREGLEALSMRRLASELGVEAMSLYHHLANKSQILDGLVDLVVAEIPLPDPDRPWRDAVRARMTAMREVLLRHPWAIRVMESRATPGMRNLLHHDAMLGCLRGAGFPVALAAHAYAVLDAYVYGFVLTELMLPFQNAEETQAVASAIFATMPDGAFPHLTELTVKHVLQPGYAYANEFPFGLALILDGLQRRLDG